MNEYTIDELHRFADWMNDRGIEARHVFAALYAESDELERQEQSATDHDTEESA